MPVVALGWPYVGSVVATRGDLTGGTRYPNPLLFPLGEAPDVRPDRQHSGLVLLAGAQCGPGHHHVDAGGHGGSNAGDP